MKKLFTALLALMLWITPLAEAQTENTPESTGDAGVMTEAVQQSTLLLQLKQKLAQIRYRYTLLQTNVEKAKENLVEVDAAINNLEMVIASLESQIEDTEKQILNVKSQKERKKMELEDLEEEVTILELQLEDQKELVGELMTLLYVKRDVYFDDEGVNPVKVLASEGSVSETLQKITYLDLIEGENQVQINKMMMLSTELTEKWSEIRIKRSELEGLDESLAEELVRLQGEKMAQEELLDELEDEKLILESMLESADQREDELKREIRIYEENVRIMEEKLAGISGALSEDQLVLIEQIEAEMLEQFEAELAADALQLDWPISPAKGLTALFHDEGYKKTFGVDHYALDIRAKQGSSIFAPADGVVTEVIYDGESSKYAYIMVAHRMGVMTLYGHVSAPAVSAGDYVTRGQIIGFTGGTPKTVGAGARTTGPHLHFEVWQDGARIDPLKYLDLTEVPEDDLPDEYKLLLQGQLAAQIKELEDALGQ